VCLADGALCSHMGMSKFTCLEWVMIVQRIYCVFDRPDQRGHAAMLGPVHIFTNVRLDHYVCRYAGTQVYNGFQFVPCGGPYAPMDSRCADCDYRRVDLGIGGDDD
jgi:hypothetical protein